jgi:Mg-chelatase subunit ChlD
VSGLRDLPSIARTPVILAVRQELATKIAVAGSRPSWQVLEPDDEVRTEHDLIVMLPDPRRSAAGIAVVNVVNARLEGRSDLMKVMADIIPGLRRSILPSQQDLLALLDDPRQDPTGTGMQPMIVATEQALFAHNVTKPKRLATGIYPQEGAVSLDYPYVITTRDPARRESARRFQRLIGSAQGRRALQDAGFRTADGKPGTKLSDQYGLRRQEPDRIPKPPTEVTTRVLLSLRLLLATTRALLVVDTSGSMGEPVPGTGQSRIAVTAKLAQEGVDRLPPGSEVGIWRFATKLDGDKDYEELLPIGPVDGGEDEIRKVLGKLPQQVGGYTGLYDSILAAFRKAGEERDPDKVSTVILFTDGKNDTDKQGISLDELVATITQEFDERRPVNIAAIGFGGDVDPVELNKIAEAANGRAYVVDNLDEARQVMLDVIARRVCVISECPA